MEYATSINFTFDTPEKTREIGGLFKTLDETALDTEEIMALFRPHSEAAAQRLPNLIDNHLWESINFTAPEEIIITDKKVTLLNTVGTGADAFIPEFMAFILALGGKPLTCKAIEDEEESIYKYSKKSGIQCTVKSRW